MQIRCLFCFEEKFLSVLKIFQRIHFLVFQNSEFTQYVNLWFHWRFFFSKFKWNIFICTCMLLLFEYCKFVLHVRVCVWVCSFMINFPLYQSVFQILFWLKELYFLHSTMKNLLSLKNCIKLLYNYYKQTIQTEN